jgi:cytosine/adenosine deaminase-related metal-dependent hydrolase
MSTLLKNAKFIDYKSFEIKETNIIVKEGIDGKITFTNENPGNIDSVIDCKGNYVTKSFACGHHHVYSALARGMNPPKKNPENFYEILEYVWWTLDKCLDKESIEASAYATAIACAKNGVTFCIDHHASPFAVEGSLQIIADAFDKVGVSHLLCYEITDRDGLDIAEKGLKETEEYMKNNQALVGLHASFTVGEETLKKSVALAKEYNSGLHIHVAEDGYDQEHSEKTFGKRVVQRLKDTGVLDFSKTILGHCLHLEDNERKLIGDAPCWVVQNTESNYNNNVGIFNSKGLGNNIMLGTDGMHSNMVRSAKTAFFSGSMFENEGFDFAYNRLRNTHQYLNENQFKGDGDNNLVIFNYNPPTPLNGNNFLGHFVYGLEASDISHVISNGKLIVENQKVLTVDEDEVMEKARIAAVKLWERMDKID